jgi:hypothetical protein
LIFMLATHNFVDKCYDELADDDVVNFRKIQ